MSDRPLRLGPDPNLTYMDRWNEMQPDRYGRPDTYDGASGDRRQRGAKGDEQDNGGSGSFLESFLGLAILILAPLTGAIATLLIYRWTAPDQLTTGRMLGYTGVFLVTSWACAMLVYALRRLLLAAVIVGVICGIGYLTWVLWLT